MEAFERLHAELEVRAIMVSAGLLVGDELETACSAMLTVLEAHTMTFPDEERDCQIHGHAWEDTKSYTLSGGNPHYKCRFCRTIFIDMD